MTARSLVEPGEVFGLLGPMGREKRRFSGCLVGLPAADGGVGEDREARLPAAVAGRAAAGRLYAGRGGDVSANARPRCVNFFAEIRGGDVSGRCKLRSGWNWMSAVG